MDPHPITKYLKPYYDQPPGECCWRTIWASPLSELLREDYPDSPWLPEPLIDEKKLSIKEIIPQTGGLE